MRYSLGKKPQCRNPFTLPPSQQPPRRYTDPAAKFMLPALLQHLPFHGDRWSCTMYALLDPHASWFPE